VSLDTQLPHCLSVTAALMRKSSAGSVDGSVLFADKPGRPENLQVSDVDAEQCKLLWSRPTNDGGSDITGIAARSV